MLNNCVFCKFVENPDLVFNQTISMTKQFYVMLAANPQTPGHILVIPKVHFIKLIDLPRSMQLLLFSEAIKLGEGLKRVLGAKAYVIKVNNELYQLESHDSQHVGHIHIHVIPRYKAKEKLASQPKRQSDKMLKSIKDQFMDYGKLK